VTRDIPVIIISIVDGRDLGMALGAEDYLLKPIDPRGSSRDWRPSSAARAARAAPRRRRRAGRPRCSTPPWRKGYAVDALSGERARGRLAAPTLVILDLMMPGMDGSRWPRRMKEAPS
jgi:DNA-binding response OmpR family regulator